VRIIAGTLRGRWITVPDGGGVRPTADRVREALFSILGDQVPGARVLDPFAGSGALGLEAISRGAATAVLIEADRHAVAVVRENVASLGVEDRVRVIHSDAVSEIERSRNGGPWDLVLADPPYGDGSGSRLLRALVVAGALAPGATVVLENDASEPVPEARPPLVAGRRAKYGRIALDFLQFLDSQELG
jgi:16S rRNA (guanine966-N2)-methyltransferase